MLKAEHRLRRSTDFQSVVRRGLRVGRPTLVVHLLPAGDSVERPTSVGLIVGRVVGGAVDRNTVRRRFRHLLQARIDRFPVGSQVVVRALPGSARATSRTLATELDTAIERVVSRAGRRS